MNEAEFRNVVDYIARKTEGKDQKKHKIEAFVQFYEYEAAQGLYYLKEYEGANAGDKKLYDEKRRAVLFNIFSSSDLHLGNVLKRYDVYDAIETVFCGTKVYYRGREQTEATEARNEYRTGSV
ncbi:hypothetical protein, partial [Treponema socranskii]|uniref:hypothetical protein n=1 Tax=Treponema socranskii TaxID=53419 RepID=UPI003D8FDFBF